jgi:hypothetical protein
MVHKILNLFNNVTILSTYHVLLKIFPNSQDFKLGMLIQGPLITDGQNSCKWTYHCVGLSKSFIMIKISS